MKKVDVVILTESRYENPIKMDWYTNQVLIEDRLVQQALERKGLNIKRIDWATPNFDWASTNTALFRSTWDYFNRFEEFSNWLKKTSQQTQLINSSELINWNMDKNYLSDLSKKNINIPKTEFIKKGTITNLKEIHEKNNWQKTVLKPTFSGAARHTYRMDLTVLDSYERIFQELIANEDMMLQVFQDNIIKRGEISIMVIGGEFTHAVLKIAKKGDFRVQDDFGGSVQDYTPTAEEILFAENAIKKCPEQPLYARVDIFYDNNDELAVGELELIEPELWFRKNHNAADKLVDTIYNQYF